VVYVAAEEDLGAVLRPKLRAAGANLQRVYLIDRAPGQIVYDIVDGKQARVTFHVLATAFEIVAAQAGLTIGQLLDPVSGQSSMVLSGLATWIATAVFLGADVHLGCIRAVAESFATAPPGHVAGLAAAGQGLVALAEICFEGAVQLAGPLTVFVFAVHLGQSLLGRMAPNIQLFWAIGPVLSVGIGLFVLAAVMPSLISTWFALMPQALSVMNSLPAGR
jgi:flagellar biosynthesis protein FliR